MSKFVKLSSIAELTVGFVGTMAKHYEDEGIPFLRSLNIKPFKIISDDMKLRKPLHHSSHLITIPSVNKGKHACQRVFPSLFVLFALAGARPPASQKPKIARISIAGRCGQFCRSRNASRQGKARREYCRIVKGLDAVWAYFCPSKPCLPLSTDGIYDVCVSTP